MTSGHTQAFYCIPCITHKLVIEFEAHGTARQSTLGLPTWVNVNICKAPQGLDNSFDEVTMACFSIYGCVLILQKSKKKLTEKFHLKIFMMCYAYTNYCHTKRRADNDPPTNDVRNDDAEKKTDDYQWMCARFLQVWGQL